jgi:hypothetical protein
VRFSDSPTRIRQHPDDGGQILRQLVSPCLFKSFRFSYMGAIPNKPWLDRFSVSTHDGQGDPDFRSHPIEVVQLKLKWLGVQ